MKIFNELLPLLLSGRGILKSQNGFFFCQEPEYLLRKTSGKCSFSVILVQNSNLGHVRLYGVDIFKLIESYRSSADLFFFIHQSRREK